MLNKDYKEMLQCLSEENVKFLLVGAYALAAHGYPRATKDIDFFVWATPQNAANLMRALAKFGAPMDGISEADFSSEGVIFQIGNSPRRIDIITNIDGVKFAPLDYYAHAPQTFAMLERLASEHPTTLACMHGSAWRGDGAKLLRELSKVLAGSPAV